MKIFRRSINRIETYRNNEICSRRKRMELISNCTICDDIDDVHALNRLVNHVKVYLIIARDRSVAYSGKGNILSHWLSNHRFHKNPDLRHIIRFGSFWVCVVAWIPSTMSVKHIFTIENICNVFLREYARYYLPTMRVVNDFFHHCEKIYFW